MRSPAAIRMLKPAKYGGSDRGTLPLIWAKHLLSDEFSKGEEGVAPFASSAAMLDDKADGAQ